MTISCINSAPISSPQMEQRPLGKTGISVSALGLGCWQLGGEFGPLNNEMAVAILDKAKAVGISLLDTSDVFGNGMSESRIGSWVKFKFSSQLVSTKVGRNKELYPKGYQYDRMRRSIEGSLERLGISKIKLLQLQCVPHSLLEDRQLWRWLQDFQREGIIEHIGASVDTVEDAIACLQIPKIATIQIALNIFRQDALDYILPAAQAAEVGVIVRQPLASGLLAGKMDRDTRFVSTDHRNYNRAGGYYNISETFSGLRYIRGLSLVEKLKDILPAHTPLSQLALRWCLDQPGVSSVLVGASSPEQVTSNAQACALPPLSKDVHQQLYEFYQKEVRPFVQGTI